MKSDARSRLHYQFKNINIGIRFQMVNTIMGAAVPNSLMFRKVDDSSALRLDNNTTVRMKPDTLVELSD